MIADWTVDVSPESPSIEVPWSGWVDLRCAANGIRLFSESRAKARILETQQYPELLELLRSANHLHTVTSKVDVFPVDRSEVDPEIAEAGTEATACGVGSYLDVLTFRLEVFSAFADFEQVALNTAKALSSVPAATSCAEIVVRPARLYDRHTFGWTVYAIGFAGDPYEARRCWFQAATIVLAALHAEIASKIAPSIVGHQQK